jgi:hypothetical protein
VGHRVKTHRITPATGEERGDIEIKDYVVLQKPHEQVKRVSPPRTLILDFTMTHTLFGVSILHSNGQLTHTRRVKNKLRHYRQNYLNKPDPLVFMSVVVNTTGRIYDDFSCLLFLDTHREASALVNELTEESDQFRFLRDPSLENLQGSSFSFVRDVPHNL